MSRNQTPPPVCMYIWGWCLLLLINWRKLATSGLQHKPSCNQVCWVLRVRAHFTPLKCMRKDSHFFSWYSGCLAGQSAWVCAGVHNYWELFGDFSAITHLKEQLHWCYHHFPWEILCVDVVRTVQNTEQSWCELGDSWCPQCVTVGWIYTLPTTTPGP